MEAGHIVHPDKGDMQEYTRMDKDRMNNDNLERQSRQAKENQSWEDFLQEQERNNLSLKSLLLGNKKPRDLYQDPHRNLEQKWKKEFIKEREETQRKEEEKEDEEKAKKKEERRRQKLKEAREV
ncbi:hypothetical protein SMACR_02189 [Sordaria macrospora]|uniref:WGS project CABT00000000 data, contig 2.23 n=2 Tax=Sordaria macrospora TaxID=5147 RepID=F7W2W6_SORMK|nr:uncharacterized protein SMAC_02189 [Sordaria macrospora k-hell]KAA8632067.1 hypothetical protein SMACR_02189 [Sordaria macrospora]WPJ63711.1 hypothetical protein SMAC4_02189 [Sordaria macrospora]CCC11967.1 unnamed protein product [Sordaria macrospora k-hell]